MRSLVYGLLAIALGCAAFVSARWAASESSPPPVVSAQPQVGTRLSYPARHPPRVTLPDGQTREVHSVLNVTRKLRYGEYLWDDAGIGPGPTWVRVDLARQTLSLFRGGHEIGSTVILFGTDGKPTPGGVFPILQKAEHHQSSLYDAEMPYMLRLTGDGVAIHASAIRSGAATHGCVGVPLAFARLMFDQVKRGDIVAIVPAA